MVDLVLRDRVTASDPVAASEALRSVFGEGRVTAADDAFEYVQASLVDDGISVTRVVCSGSGVRVATSGSPDLAVVAVRTGRLRLRRGEDDVDLGEGEIGLIPMDEAAELLWDEVALDVFSFPLTSVARLLGVEGRPVRLHAPGVVPRTAALSRYWRRLASGLADVLSEPDLYVRDLLRGQLVDALAAATIEAFGLSDVTEDDRAGDAELTHRALAFMGARLGDPISIGQVAIATGISIRGLQLLFQRELESTPVAHLRRLRLEAARAALRSPRPGTTVRSVALRVGYSNLGRFSSHYRAEYDEMPSRTLQEAGSRSAP